MADNPFAPCAKIQTFAQYNFSILFFLVNAILQDVELCYVNAMCLLVLEKNLASLKAKFRFIPQRLWSTSLTYYTSTPDVEPCTAIFFTRERGRGSTAELHNECLAPHQTKKFK
jgi:hypothetical protein